MGLVKQIPIESNYSPIYDSDIGTISNVTASSFEVSNISISDIKATLGEDTNSLVALCQSNKINPFALFRPNGNAPFSLGAFAGYNHEAKPPTHFYTKQSSFNTTFIYDEFAGVYYVDLSVLLARGERPPYVGNGWDFVQVKIVLNDTLNNEILTLLSDNKEVAKTGFTPFPIRFESDNINRSGNMTVTAFYTSGNDTLIEDSHPIIPFSINKKYDLIGHEECTTILPDTHVYYVLSGQYLEVDTHMALKVKDDNGTPLYGVGYAYPSDWPTSLQSGATFSHVIYTKINSAWQRLEVVRLEAGNTWEDYKVKDTTDYLYYITDIQVRSALPTTVAEL